MTLNRRRNPSAFRTVEYIPQCTEGIYGSLLFNKETMIESDLTNSFHQILLEVTGIGSHAVASVGFFWDECEKEISCSPSKPSKQPSSHLGTDLCSHTHRNSLMNPSWGYSWVNSCASLDLFIGNCYSEIILNVKHAEWSLWLIQDLAYPVQQNCKMKVI